MKFKYTFDVDDKLTIEVFWKMECISERTNIDLEQLFYLVMMGYIADYEARHNIQL